MACFHPLKGFVTEIKDDGKRVLKVVPYTIDHLEFRNGVCNPVSIPVVSSYSDAVVRDFITLPCGRCAGCRMAYSKQWSARCMAELQQHDSAAFLTLTYNNDHLPVNAYGDDENGEAIKSTSLRKRELQLFIKRLRRAFPDQQLRYFACGEYGSAENTFRPHYHLIVFGLKLNDLKFFKRDHRGYDHYTSESVSRVWSDPDTHESKGFVDVEQVNSKTCAYVARYTLKKLYGKEAWFYERLNLEPPFLLMSRRPGIGKLWYDEHKEQLLDFPELIFSDAGSGGKKFGLPKYFLEKLAIDFPEEADRIKENRKLAAESQIEMELSKTDLDLLEYLAVKECEFEERIKILKNRDLSADFGSHNLY